MLARVLEPEVMDSREEACDYDAMDHCRVNEQFVDDFLGAQGGAGVILDVGAGTAQIPIALIQRGVPGRVVAIDLAGRMLEVARQNVERCGFRERIGLQRCDAKRMPFAVGVFDAVMSNSIVHHIPAPLAVLAEMVRVVKPGGLLFVRDLLRPTDDGMLQQLVQTYAGGANAHQQRMFADSLHAALTLDEMRDHVIHLGFEPATVTQTSDRHWTWVAAAAKKMQKQSNDIQSPITIA